MSARLIGAAILGSVAIVLMSPTGIAAQTADARDNPAVAQAPAAHEHDHGSPAPAVKTETSQSCCAQAASGTSHDAGLSTPPAADQQSDTAKTPEKGCCGGMKSDMKGGMKSDMKGGMKSDMKGGMMSNMKKDQPMADQTPAREGHSCCCSGMKM